MWLKIPDRDEWVDLNRVSQVEIHKPTRPYYSQEWEVQWWIGDRCRYASFEKKEDAETFAAKLRREK